MSRSYIDTSIFFFNDTATTEIYPLSLHDALPIYNCNRAHSQHKAESEAILNTSHKVYIDRSLAFSRDNAWWISDVRGKDGSFAQGRKKHSSTLLINSGLNMLLYICRLSGT